MPVSAPPLAFKKYLRSIQEIMHILLRMALWEEGDYGACESAAGRISSSSLLSHACLLFGEKWTSCDGVNIAGGRSSLLFLMSGAHALANTSQDGGRTSLGYANAAERCFSRLCYLSKIFCTDIKLGNMCEYECFPGM